jgi:hypothetical protein
MPTVAAANRTKAAPANHITCSMATVKSCELSMKHQYTHKHLITAVFMSSAGAPEL